MHFWRAVYLHLHLVTSSFNQSVHEVPVVGVVYEIYKNKSKNE